MEISWKRTKSNGDIYTYTCEDDPKQVHCHLSADLVGDWIKEDHSYELT
jgi:hypothetical protein